MPDLCIHPFLDMPDLRIRLMQLKSGIS